MRTEVASLAQWLEPIVPAALAPAICAQPGFDLWSNGRALATEEVSAERLDARVLRRFRVPEADLDIEQIVELDEAHNAAVFRVKLRQGGSHPSPPLERIEPLHLRLRGVRQQPRQAGSIYALGGGGTYNSYPPPAYREHWAHLLARGGSDAFRISSSVGGRSSEDFLPLLMLEVGARSESVGLAAALEWSGEWELEVNCGTRGILDTASQPQDDQYVTGGPLVSNLVLQPGEALELPPVHVMFFAGGMDSGFNAVRRYLYDCICPRLDGKPPLPPVSYDHWCGIWEGLDEELLIRQVGRCADIGMEYFVLDAGWFPGVQDDFSQGVGNWARVDLSKFPRGLESLAESVRQHGMAFGLWFDVERAHRASDVAREHPGWFWDIGREYLHLNLTLDEAQEYVLTTVSGWIERLDLRWSRWDYNIDPAPYWRMADPTGKVQFAYLNGLYRVLDTLMQRYPQWLLEACASGGRRIDLGTLRRAPSACISDHTAEPHICRFMQTGASRFLPGHLLSGIVPASADRADLPNAGLEFLSRMAGALSLNGRLDLWPDSVVAEAARHVAAYKSIRHLLAQDFYALTPQPTSDHDWDAVQFAAYDGSEAVVFVFRMGGDEAERCLRLKGLKRGAEYWVTDSLGDGSRVLYPARRLEQSGLAVSLEQDQGRLYHITAG